MCNTCLLILVFTMHGHFFGGTFLGRKGMKNDYFVSGGVPECIIRLYLGETYARRWERGSVGMGVLMKGAMMDAAKIHG